MPDAGIAPDHEILPREGTMYSLDGLPADPPRTIHYPVEAICAGCGMVIRLGRRLAIGPEGSWQHTGRMPGEPG